MIRRELSTLAKLAGPIILAQLSQMGMGVADAVMAGRVGSVDLAGVTLGGNLYWPTLFLVNGVMLGLAPSVSQLHGAGRQRHAGEVVRQALWFALLGGSTLILFMNNVEWIYRAVGVDERAIPVAVGYLHALSFGVFPLLAYLALRYLCEGLSWTLPAMFLGMSGLVLKVILNYWFIYGGLGIEPMGGVGCGYASSLVVTYQVTVMAIIVGKSRIRVAGFYERFSMPDPREIWRLLKLGMPIGLTTSLEMAMFSVTTILIGTISVEAVAAHQIAGNVGGLAFMLPLALGMAAAIRVGYNVGAQDFDAARRSGWVAICVSLCFAVFAALVLVTFRDAIAGLYSTEAAVVGVAAQLLLFVAFFQLFDDAQATAIGALRGYKDTRTPMFIALFAYWLVGFPVGVILGFGLLGFPEWGLHGFWVGLTLGLAVAATAFVTRFHWLVNNPQRIRALSAG